MTVVVPWPVRDLWRNNKPHWAAEARAKKKARALTYYAALNAKVSAGENITVTFHPPDKRRRDRDNMIAAIKGHLDGLSDALGIDDSRFNLKFEFGDVQPRNGEVHFDVS